jgi:tRNA 2-thiouridine synthesizing protein E
MTSALPSLEQLSGLVPPFRVAVEERQTLDESGDTREREQQAAGTEAQIQEFPVDVDERGFMRDLSRWTPEAATYLARRQGLPQELDQLTPEHWQVIGHIREHYGRVGGAPSRQDVCANAGLNKQGFSRLFPGGLMMAIRVSGLPGPQGSSDGRVPDAHQVLTRNWWAKLSE